MSLQGREGHPQTTRRMKHGFEVARAKGIAGWVAFRFCEVASVLLVGWF